MAEAMKLRKQASEVSQPRLPIGSAWFGGRG